MTRRAIGGPLGIRDLALLHRPLDREEMRAAVVELRSRGMTDYAIAAATGLSVEMVRRMRGELRT
jgi:hypothetical protein